MFSEAPFCDDSFAAFWYDLWNGEIFFFNGDIRTIENFIVHIKEEDSHDFRISQATNLSSNIKTDSIHSVTINQNEPVSGIR